jgi:hypothetical protein
MMKVKLRSAYTVMMHGIGVPSSFWVTRELLAELHDVHALLTERRPIGGEGLADPRAPAA